MRRVVVIVFGALVFMAIPAIGISAYTGQRIFAFVLAAVAALILVICIRWLRQHGEDDDDRPNG